MATKTHVNDHKVEVKTVGINFNGKTYSGNTAGLNAYNAAWRLINKQYKLKHPTFENVFISPKTELPTVVRLAHNIVDGFLKTYPLPKTWGEKLRKKFVDKGFQEASEHMNNLIAERKEAKAQWDQSQKNDRQRYYKRRAEDSIVAAALLKAGVV